MTFSDLSRNPRAVAERARRLGRLRITVPRHPGLLPHDGGQGVIAGWRATGRIKADESLYRQALVPTKGDFGPVQALG